MAPVSHFFQVFDSNQNRDKLLRFKVGSGKVIRVSFRATLEDANRNHFWSHLVILCFVELCFCLWNQGWEEGMLGMKKSGHRRIIVPPHLAYGPKGVPGRVPANSTLIFEVELQRVPSPPCHILTVKRSLSLFFQTGTAEQMSSLGL